MSEKSLSRRNLLGGSAGLAAGAVFMSALNPAAAAAPAVSDLAKTDPEYARFFKHFDEEEVAKTVEPVLGKAHRHFVILAALLGCGGKEEFEVRLPQALDAGVTPIQVREIVYQATAYLGMGRVRGFVDTMNRVFTSRGVKLPLPDTTEQKDVERVVKGEAAQVEIFGSRMKGFATSSPEKTVAIRRWLSATASATTTFAPVCHCRNANSLPSATWPRKATPPLRWQHTLPATSRWATTRQF